MIEAETITTRMQDVVDWLEGQGFTLQSEKDIHTRSSTRTQHDLVIDLTFANETACRQGVLQNHSINPDLALLSDHHALTFTIGNPREVIVNITKAKYNWKDAKEEDFVEALYQKLHNNLTLY